VLPSSKHAGPRSRATRGAKVGVPAFVATVIALILVGIAIWGLWASAAVARLVANASTGPTEQNLSVATFLLVWLVCFGPFLYFATAILWSTLAPESHAWLAPLRLFNFIVGLRTLAESRRWSSGDKSKAPRASPQRKRLSPPENSTHNAENSKPT